MEKDDNPSSSDDNMVIRKLVVSAAKSGEICSDGSVGGGSGSNVRSSATHT